MDKKYLIKYGIKKLKSANILKLPLGISSLGEETVKEITKYDLIEDLETGELYTINYFLKIILMQLLVLVKV